jgi:hypothetical protein
MKKTKSGIDMEQFGDDLSKTMLLPGVLDAAKRAMCEGDADADWSGDITIEKRLFMRTRVTLGIIATMAAGLVTISRADIPELTDPLGTLAEMLIGICEELKKVKV